MAYSFHSHAMGESTDQNKGKFSVVVDKRERNPALLSLLEGLGGQITLDTIQSGDYIVSERIGIERKTMPDFEKSIIDGRLFDQASALKSNYKFPILIIEGNDVELHLGKKVFIGALMALLTDFGIYVLRSSGETETAELISLIAQRELKSGISEPSPKHGIKASTTAQFQEQVIGNLPGVGPKLSRSLLRHFVSIRKIAEADVKELMSVEKIGKKKAKAIHNIINAAYALEP